MEHSARRRLTFGTLLAALLLLPLAAWAQRDASFSLSSSKTFSPDEKPAIHLYTHNVRELEFRIYKVKDPVKFISGLKDPHGFDNGAAEWGPKEQIDEETWLERFHDWKHHIWYVVRTFFRDQFSSETREKLREKQSSLAERSRIVGVAEFAQIPLLNDKQLIARWRQEVPPTYISDAQDLPIGPLPPGIYLVEATDAHYKAYTVLMVSRFVVVTRTTPGNVLAFCVDRKSGAPVANAGVTMGTEATTLATGKTGGDGVVELAATLPKKNAQDFEQGLWVVAATPDDVAVVTPENYSFSQARGDNWQSYVYTDRPVYRPGHTVFWKAVLRARVENHLELPKLNAVEVTIADQQDHPVFHGNVPLSKDGTLTGKLALDAHAALGYYTIRLGSQDRGEAEADDAESGMGSGSFRVEEYRKPEYQVRINAAKPRVIQGETMPVVIDSRYFFGEPVAGGKVKYRVYSSQHFWWSDEEDDSDAPPAVDEGNDDSAESLGYDAAQQSEQTGTLDANGKLTIQVPAKYNPKAGYDLDYAIEAGVTDAANREITGRGRFLATVGSFRIHVEPESYAAPQGQVASFKVSAVDYDNKPVQTTVHLQLVYRHWANGKTSEEQGPTADVTTDVSGNATAALKVDKSGSAEITATAVTPEQRTVRDVTWLWVLGSGESDFADNSHRVQVLTDKKTYAPGDTAHVSIISHADGFHALVVATGYTTEFQQVISSNGRTITFDLPITPDSQPNLQVNALFVRDGELFEASKAINVPAVQQRLQVVIAPASQTFQPEQTAHYDVYTRDFQDRPVVSDFSFGVVDEALYSIYPEESGDIVSALYPKRYVWASTNSSLEYRFYGHAGMKSPMLAWKRAYHPLLAQVKPGNDVVQPKVRKAFPDTAYWAPDVHTDAQGHASVNFSFPDSLTTWRTTVRAVTTDSKAGSLINRVIVRKNIIVRLGTPRFLRKGDEVVVPVIAHNYLDHPKQIEITLNAQGLDIVSGATKQITVASRADGTVNWRLKASRIGTATLLAKALSTEESDALEISFPVEPAGVPQNKVEQGVVRNANGSAQANLVYPPSTDPAARTLHIEVSPSVAGSIFPALQYLSSYPYGCTEQTMSSFVPNILVAETLKKLGLPPGLAPAELNDKIKAGLDRLAAYQHDDGGWGWWQEDQSRVFMTAYVVSGLAEAEHVYTFDSEQQPMLERGRKYLVKQLEQHPRMLPDLRAYVVYALSGAGASDQNAQLDTLWSRRKDLSAEGLAMTGLAMLAAKDTRAEQIATLLTGRAKFEGQLAYWPSNYSPLLDISYDNDTESTAFALRFLARATPHATVVEQAAQWLVAHRDGGYWWESTEQTAFALFGLTEYLAVSKELDADFDVEIRVNGKAVANRHFTSADAVSGATLKLDVPTASLDAATSTVQIAKHGAGSAYWIAQTGYYSTDKRLYQKGNLSLNVARDYSLLTPENKDGKIVYRMQPLQRAVRPGDILAVHLGITGSAMKYLMLEDPIPAGAEFLQHDDSYEILNRPNDWSYWYTRREFHDDRAVIFSTEFSGRQDTFYLLRVVNPGNFNISPARVSLMYQPDVDATSDPLTLQVEQP